MARNKKPKKVQSLGDLGGMVYSTNPDYEFESHEEEAGSTGDETLYVSRDKKGRGGKMATLVEGFEGNAIELAELGKWLKQQCGVGGTAKDGEIVIQGDKKERVAELLRQKGYKVKLKGG
ncbi:MAG: translation initiation factor [Bacteroidetes bacterium]|nr:translation initiation factor [Bacteroidota bacterium]